MISEFDVDPRFSCLSSGIIDAEDFKRYPISVGQYVSRYYELWTRNVIAKIHLTSEIDIAYGFADKVGVVRGLKFDRYSESSYFMKRLKDDAISHVYYMTFETSNVCGIPILFSYYYLAKVNFADEIVCLQTAEDDDGRPLYMPLSFKHSEEQLLQMFWRHINLRFNVSYN